MADSPNTMDALIKSIDQSVKEVQRVLERPVLSADAIRSIAIQLSQANNFAQRLQGAVDEQLSKKE